VEHAELVPPGHIWTPEKGYERYFKPDWLKPVFTPEEPKPALPTGSTDGLRARLSAAVQKRLMSDVGYGLLLSGGLDSAIVAKLMSELTDMSKIMSFTVGQANSPDIMAARAIAQHFGTDHHEFIFSSKEVLQRSTPIRHLMPPALQTRRPATRRRPIVCRPLRSCPRWSITLRPMSRS